jgi:hypothetical protein
MSLLLRSRTEHEWSVFREGRLEWSWFDKPTHVIECLSSLHADALRSVNTLRFSELSTEGGYFILFQSPTEHATKRSTVQRIGHLCLQFHLFPVGFTAREACSRYSEVHVSRHFHQTKALWNGTWTQLTYDSYSTLNDLCSWYIVKLPQYPSTTLYRRIVEWRQCSTHSIRKPKRVVSFTPKPLYSQLDLSAVPMRHTKHSGNAAPGSIPNCNCLPWCNSVVVFFRHSRRMVGYVQIVYELFLPVHVSREGVNETTSPSIAACLSM